MEPTTNFIPIDLPDVGKITRKGYYEADISDADSRLMDDKQILNVEFTISKGKCAGFKLNTKFYETQRSKYRLGYPVKLWELMGNLMTYKT